MSELLHVKNLHAYYQNSKTAVKAVNGVSFEVFRGEVFGIVGESGCGKSTLLRSISRIINPPGRIVDGSIIYNGQDLLTLKPEPMRKLRGREISMIFQEPMTALNPVLPIRAQLYESLDRTMTRRQKRERSIELLRLVGIPEPERRMNEYIHQFSGGMRQRAMIAIALAGGPKLLLADEPTTALDVTIRSQIIRLMNSLKGKLAGIILVTHDLGIVAQMCDRVAVMYEGQIVECRDTLALFTEPRHPYTKRLLSAIRA